MPAELTYTARIRGPYVLERSRDQTIQVPILLDAVLVPPEESGSTCALLASDGSEIASGPVTVEDEIATWVVEGATTSALELSEDLAIVWSLEIEGVIRTYRAPAILALCAPSPAASALDLYTLAPALEPGLDSSISHVTSWDRQIGEAWSQIQNKLIARKQRPWLILGSSDLREVHQLLALALCYEAIGARIPEYWSVAQGYRVQFADAWRTMSWRYQAADTNAPGAGSRGNVGATWAGSPGARRRRGSRC